MKKQQLKAGLLATAAMAAFVVNGRAQSVDSLLNKLVDKGVLTQQEANGLRSESTNETAKPFAEKIGGAPWVESLKFGGDFRMRYDGVYQDADNTGSGSATENRQRFRYRLRYGVTAGLSDHFETGLRLGSGEVGSAAPSYGGSPFSANTTIGNDSSRKFIFVDLAYVKWKPTDWFGGEFGKMASQFWLTDMVLDPDYNPEGAQQKFNVALNDRHKLSLTTGEFVIAENYDGTGTDSQNQDVYLFMGELDWAAKWSDQLSSRLALASYGFANQSAISTNLENFLNQNGTSAAGPGAPNFIPVIVRGELTYAFASAPLFHGPFPVSLGAEYANNVGATSFGQNEAYNVGLTLGDARKKGNWQLTYNYKHIGSAAVWHGINDDDFGYNAKGGTSVAGHQIIASYHPYNPLTINLRYMITHQIDAPPGVSSEQMRLFFDLLFAF
jgi:hypothetical protein